MNQGSFAEMKIATISHYKADIFTNDFGKYPKRWIPLKKTVIKRVFLY